MLDNDVVLEPELLDPPEPVFHTGKEPYLGAVLPEALLCHWSLPDGLRDHEVHPGKVAVHAVLPGKPVGLLPELSHVVAYLLYEPLRLHVIGGERLVEVVADRDDRVALLVPA